MLHNAILVTRGAKASGVVKSTICFSKKIEYSGQVGNTQRSGKKKTHKKITRVEDYRISPAKLKTERPQVMVAALKAYQMVDNKASQGRTLIMGSPQQPKTYCSAANRGVKVNSSKGSF